MTLLGNFPSLLLRRLRSTAEGEDDRDNIVIATAHALLGERASKTDALEFRGGSTDRNIVATSVSQGCVDVPQGVLARALLQSFPSLHGIQIVVAEQDTHDLRARLWSLEAVQV